MDNLMKEKLVKSAYEGYLEMAEDEYITIDLNGFSYCEECKNDDGELDLDLIKDLNKLLICEFEKNGFEVYQEGGIYAKDGNFKDVLPDTAVAVKENQNA